MPAKKIAKGALVGGNVLVSDEKEANSLYQKSYFGDIGKGGKLKLALVEALYLIDNGKLGIKEGRKKITFDKLLETAKKSDPTIFEQYIAYTDLRDRGYVVKTGFKFGGHFRVYERGNIPGQSHSTFLVHAIPEHYSMTMTEISRIVRLGHSVKKNMWLAVVDNEGDLTYYQVKRIKP